MNSASSIFAVTNRYKFSSDRSSYAVYRGLLLSLARIFGVKFHAVVPNLSEQDMCGMLSDKIKIVRLVQGREGWLDMIPYSHKLLGYTRGFLKRNKVSLIHHVFYCYKGLESFNALALFGVIRDYPFVLGPAEVPHMYFADDHELYEPMLSRSSFIKTEYQLVGLLRAYSEVLLRWGFNKTISECDALVVVNEATRKVYRKFLSDRKIKVIPLGINLNEFPFSPPPLNQNVLSVGNCIKRKGFEYLIKAMVKVRKEYPYALLHLIGDGPRRTYLEALRKKLGLGSSVMFHGRVSQNDLLFAYRNCRVFCHPSISEGFCHTTLEAMVCGRPVISTNTIGSDMVEDGQTGFLVPVADSDAIAEWILAMFDDDELTYKMGIKARKKTEEYDWAKIARKYYDLYVSLTN